MESTIQKISKDGLQISLMNGSLWRLANIGDITKSALWYPTQRIKIEENGEGEYSLINLDTSEPDEIRVSRVL